MNEQRKEFKDIVRTKPITKIPDVQRKDVRDEPRETEGK